MSLKILWKYFLLCWWYSLLLLFVSLVIWIIIAATLRENRGILNVVNCIFYDVLLDSRRRSAVLYSLYRYVYIDIFLIYFSFFSCFGANISSILLRLSSLSFLTTILSIGFLQQSKRYYAHFSALNTDRALVTITRLNIVEQR